MLGTLDLRGVQQDSHDVGALRGYLQQLVGEPFLQTRFSYGDELTLHFGKPRTSRSKKLAHVSEGSYIVAARASSWYFKTATGPTVTMATNTSAVSIPNGFIALTAEQIEGSELAQPGARIIAADASVVLCETAQAGFACALLLSDGSSLLIAPDPELAASAEQDVADWEIFTPHERYLRVGPGPNWSYLPSTSTN